MTQSAKRVWVLSLTWVLTVIAIWPVLAHWTAPAPNPAYNHPAAALGYLFELLLCFLFFSTESKRFGKRQAFTMVLLIFMLTHTTIYAYHFIVDRGKVFLPTNTAWQQKLQHDVVSLSVDVLPHSYRFLPNAIVLWMQMCRVEFGIARDVYQLLTITILFYALYRFARLYTGYLGALIALILAGVILPVSFFRYGGQLTDPLSHLSFILAFIFLETEDFPFLLTTLLIGSLAKETVLALFGFYLLFRHREKRYLLKASLLCAASLAVYFGVRRFVLHGSVGYHDVSGVTLDHVRDNLFLEVFWPQHLLMTVGAYVPFLILAWKSTPKMLKQLVLYLFPVLFISSLLFSWLDETRNFMPMVFVLCVIAGRYLVAFQSPAGPDRGGESESATTQ